MNRTPVTGNAARQQAFRESQKAKGLAQVTVWVPAGSAADLQVLASNLVDDRDLVIGPCRRLSTGRLVKCA